MYYLIQLKSLSLTSSDSGNNENIYGLTTISSGTARGELVGGNLSIVVSLIGTDYDIDTKGKIIFLEEYIEEPYRVDRMLTQMMQAGKFDEAAGIALGVFRYCESKEENPSFTNSFTLMEVLKDRLSDLKIPVVYGLSFGHVKDKFTIPFGIRAELDADNYQIKIIRSCCNLIFYKFFNFSRFALSPIAISLFPSSTIVSPFGL